MLQRTLQRMQRLWQLQRMLDAAEDAGQGLGTDWTLDTAEDDAETLAAIEHNGSYGGCWLTQRMLKAAEVAAEESERCRRRCIGPSTL